MLIDEKLQKLISLAREGDENSFSDLAEIYKPLIESMGKSYAKKCTSELYSEEDFLQEASLALYSAVRTYENSDKVTFGLYAKICIRNKLVSLLRSANKKVKKQETPKNDLGEPVHRLLEKENANQIEKKIQAILSNLEWEVFNLYIQKKSYIEIAEILGKSVKTVDNAIYRMKTKLKQLM
ncbi:MAG: sigma-70 family RNA polymerase sigma factor [Clostridia bacterium]|nr:sigma-70 family RNA polymerase sigma factor [Clostridia bacterium]